MDEADIETYSLFSEGVLSELDDCDKFQRYMLHNFNAIANRLGLEVEVSQRRLIEAYDFWREDVARTLHEGIGKETIQLDHFKNAAFIAFWLRRMIPINATRLVHPKYANPSTAARARRQFFLRYGNEICALLVGYQICLNYECAKIYPARDSVHPLYGDRLTYLRMTKLPEALLSDFVMILKHKNMSPHSLYLLYKSLFAQLVQAR